MPNNNDHRPKFLALLADLTRIISSFCARLYGQRRAKRKTEKIVQELETPDAAG